MPHLLAPRLLALPDKFRGSATAAEVGAAMASAAAELGWSCTVRPVSDGGEGLLECFGGANRFSVVTGPLGAPVTAGWHVDVARGRAVVEMAAASGLALVAGHNDPRAATTRGTGELIAAALDCGADEVLVGVGGSATTDGGLGAVEVLSARAPLARVSVAADVTTRFVDAARLFAPQKGADAPLVAELTDRLTRLALEYRDRFGVDVTELAGGGAAGGLGGGLAALGARLRPGFDVVAEQLGLADAVATADLVITGEGRLDATSLLGKAPLGVVRLAAAGGTPVALVAGDVDRAAVAGVAELDRIPILSLTERVGRPAALADPLPAIRAAVRDLLAHHASRSSRSH